VLRRGLALTPVKFGISFTVAHLNQAGALLHVYSDGSVHLNHGGTEMGQGLFTKVRQIVADEFGIDPSRIGVSATRTDKVPNTSPTAASAGTDLNGMAAQDAARSIRERLANWVATRVGAPPGTVRFGRGRVSCAGFDASFAEVAHQAWMARIPLSATGFYRTPSIHYDRESASGHPFFYFAGGAAVSEVVVDTLTGEYRLLGVDILHDVGRSINPALDIGQIEGGFVQGLGWLTTEELVWDSRGRLLSNSPANYKIPACADVPRRFNVSLLENAPNREATIHHSKAVGEPPLMLAISAWCAIRDAVASLADYRRAPRLDAPATCERVRAAVRELRGDAP
jgi:xanthine dehydrogenase large subunit